MDNPSLYNNSNDLQKRDSESCVLENYYLLKKIRTGFNVIDIGCGDGFVTTNILKKYLQEDIGTLTGVDRSLKMINFANRFYGSSEVFFEIMNFDQALDQNTKPRFDLLTSFYCFQFLLDSKTTISNIYNLLVDGGMCLFMFPIQHPTFDVYQVMMNQPKWADIMSKGKKNESVPITRSSDDIQNEYNLNLKKFGFRNIKIKSEIKQFEYQSLKSFTDFFKSVNIFLKSTPEDKVQEMCDDMLEIYSRSPLIDMNYDKQGNIKSVITTYKLLTVSAFK